MAVLAHPDDESLGFGGALARAVREGIETHLITATLGQRGRLNGKPPGDPEHPGPDRMAELREAELLGAAEALGVKELSLLRYMDGALDQVDAREAITRIAAHVRGARPQVVLTFGPDGAYGHPDHIAVCQLTTAALVVAADPAFVPPGAEALAPHAVSKLYYRVWPPEEWLAYQATTKKLGITVDGVHREPVAWPHWEITTVIDTRGQWPTVWKAVSCHQSQITAYEKLSAVPPDQHEALWGRQHFYRALSTVNGGRAVETDLFAGLRD
jgi:LmbE family N-acetylglucosaminyl deacetylase